MRRSLLAAALLLSTGAAWGDQIGVSVSIGQPGFYGQINIGSAPPPPVIYSQPTVVQPVPEYVSAPPLYLHVPPGYERHWREHCGEYNACGRRVFFVSHDWYQNVYAPRYRHEHEHDRVEHRDPHERDWRETGDHHGDHGHDRDHEHQHEHEDRDR
jgi:hypothetical protein